MASISLVTSGTGSGTSIDGADVTLTLPTLAQNDVVYLTIYGRNRVGGPVPSTTGYSQVGSNVSNNSTLLKVYRKVMGATPDTQAVITGTGNASDSMECLFHCLRGVDTTTPEDGVTPTTATGSSTNPDGPSVTTATNNAWVFTAAGSTVNDASITGPSGYSNVVTATANDTNPTSAGAATKLVATAGAENPATWTNWSSGSWGAISFSIRPSPITYVESDMASSGAASSSVVSSGIHRVALSSAGVGTATPAGARVKPTAVASSGAAALSLSAKKLQVGGVSITGAGSQSLAAAAIWRVSIAMAGVGASANVGAQVKLTNISLAGVAAASFASNFYAGTVLNGPGAAATALVGINESFQGDLVVAGLSPLSLRGAAIRKVEMASTGVGAMSLTMSKIWNARMVSAGIGAAGPAGGAFATSAIGTGAVTADGSATSNLNGSAYRQMTMSATGLAAGTLRVGKVKTMIVALSGAATPLIGGASLHQGAMAAPGAGVMSLRGSFVYRSQFAFAGFTTSALDGVVFWGNFRRAHDTATRPAENRLSTRPNEPRETTR